jgi:preprotein translocase subunit Sss1
MAGSKTSDPFHDLEYKIVRITLLILLVLGALGLIIFTVKHLIDFVMSLWGIHHTK